MITQCSHCSVTAVGQHEQGCPMFKPNPNVEYKIIPFSPLPCHPCAEQAQRIADLERALRNTRLNLDRMTYYNPEEDQLNVELIIAEIRIALEGK